MLPFDLSCEQIAKFFICNTIRAYLPVFGNIIGILFTVQ